jgi:hypothetical protein
MGSFLSSTAEVICGKQEGAGTIRANTVIHLGMKAEIPSVQTTAISCSIKDGNVFAGQ